MPQEETFIRRSVTLLTHTVPSWPNEIRYVVETHDTRDHVLKCVVLNMSEGWNDMGRMGRADTGHTRSIFL